MNNLLLDKINDTRRQAIKQAEHAHVLNELSDVHADVDIDLIQRAADLLQFAVVNFLLESLEDDNEKLQELKLTAADAFRLLRTLPTQPITWKLASLYCERVL